MLWAIKHDTLGAYVIPCEDNGYSHSYEDLPMLFDTYREACLWIIHNLDNRYDEYHVVAYLP